MPRIYGESESRGGIVNRRDEAQRIYPTLESGRTRGGRLHKDSRAKAGLIEPDQPEADHVLC